MPLPAPWLNELSYRPFFSTGSLGDMPPFFILATVWVAASLADMPLATTVMVTALPSLPLTNRAIKAPLPSCTGWGWVQSAGRSMLKYLVFTSAA